MAAGFHHFAITRKICLEFGVSESQSNLLAHFASVYADGMKGKISEINCQFGSGYYPELTSEFSPNKYDPLTEIINVFSD